MRSVGARIQGAGVVLAGMVGSAVRLVSHFD
jgi:hypothetical protein